MTPVARDSTCEDNELHLSLDFRQLQRNKECKLDMFLRSPGNSAALHSDNKIEQG